MNVDDASSLWTEMSTPLRAFVARRVPSEIDPADVVQDVFVKIIEHLPTLREQQRVDAWIFQITRNAIVDALRARHGTRDLAERFAREHDASDHEGDEVRAAVAELTPCLAPMAARLAEPYRSAIVQTELDGITQTEAAKRAGVSVSGMKSRVQRGRDQLKDMLLACCEIAVDRRGGVMDCEARDPACNTCARPPTN